MWAARRRGLDGRVAAPKRPRGAFRGDSDGPLSQREFTFSSSLLSGVWRLVYTDAFETLAVLRIANAMPGVTAGRLTQTIAISTGRADSVNDATAAPSASRHRHDDGRLGAVVRDAKFRQSRARPVPGSQRCLRARSRSRGGRRARGGRGIAVRLFPDVGDGARCRRRHRRCGRSLDPARNAAKAAVTVLGDAVPTLKDAIGAETVTVPVPESFPGARVDAHRVRGRGHAHRENRGARCTFSKRFPESR